MKGLGVLIILGLIAYAVFKAKPVEAGRILGGKAKPEVERRRIVEATDRASADLIVSKIRGAGGRVETSYGELIQAVLTPSQEAEIAALSYVRQVRAPMVPAPA